MICLVSQRLHYPVASGMRADVAAQVIHSTLLQRIRDQEPLVRRDQSIEHLHHFRVAVRRTRSALGQLKKVFEPQARRTFQREFAWLGDISGPQRDLDVLLQALARYQAEQSAEALQPLLHLIQETRDEHHQRLVCALESQRFRQLLEDWSEFLGRKAPSGPHAGRPVGEVASERIGFLWNRFLERGRAIRPETSDAALHRVRIDGKKLRYLLEFFRGLFDERRVEETLGELKRLQDCLGSFNDLNVQQRELAGFAEGLPDVTVIEGLNQDLAARQAGERRRFHQLFQRFSEKFGNDDIRMILKPNQRTSSES